MDEKKFYSFQDILKFLSFDYKFETKSYGYPFNRKKEDVTFSWGQILIPKEGIREMVQNKISDIKEAPLSEIHMMYQIPFTVKNKDGSIGLGTINEDISLSFRYDKEYKYGDINKSIYEVCFCILQVARETNHFFIIDDTYLHEFFSYYIIDNQWGLGATVPVSGCKEVFGAEPEPDCPEEDCAAQEDKPYPSALTILGYKYRCPNCHWESVPTGNMFCCDHCGYEVELDPDCSED